MQSRTVSNTDRSQAERIIDRLHVEAQYEGTVPSRFLDLLALVMRERVWEERNQSFIDFIESDYPQGVGIPKEELEKVIELKHKHEDKKADKAKEIDAMREAIRWELNPKLKGNKESPGSGRGNKSPGTPRAFRASDFNTAAYAIGRLRRDRPELAEKVIKGEISANAAAIEAGFRKKTIKVPLEPQAAAKRLLLHFDREELIQALRDV